MCIVYVCYSVLSIVSYVRFTHRINVSISDIDTRIHITIKYSKYIHNNNKYIHNNNNNNSNTNLLAQVYIYTLLHTYIQYTYVMYTAYIHIHHIYTYKSITRHMWVWQSFDKLTHIQYKQIYWGTYTIYNSI